MHWCAVQDATQHTFFIGVHPAVPVKQFLLAFLCIPRTKVQPQRSPVCIPSALAISSPSALHSATAVFPSLLHENCILLSQRLERATLLPPPSGRLKARNRSGQVVIQDRLSESPAGTDFGSRAALSREVACAEAERQNSDGRMPPVSGVSCALCAESRNTGTQKDLMSACTRERARRQTPAILHAGPTLLTSTKSVLL